MPHCLRLRQLFSDRYDIPTSPRTQIEAVSYALSCLEQRAALLNILQFKWEAATRSEGAPDLQAIEGAFSCLLREMSKLCQLLGMAQLAPHL